jgi:hypothetical protein
LSYLLEGGKAGRPKFRSVSQADGPIHAPG